MKFKSKGKVKIGAACVVINENKEILLGMRISKKNGNGLWQLCGGHHEYGESVHDAAIREAKEETNLDVTGVKFITFAEHHFGKNQYLTFFFIGKANGQLINTEPHKCQEWKWFGVDNLPNNLFEISDSILELIKVSVKEYAS